MFEQLSMGGNPTAWLAVLLVIVLLFGANRIPEIMRGIGSGMREFKKGLEEDEDAGHGTDNSTKENPTRQ